MLPLLLAAALLPDFAADARALQKALGERDPGPLADAAYALRDDDHEASARLLLGVLLRDGTPDFVLDAAVDALARHASAESGGVIARAVERTKDDRRFLLLEAAGRHGSPEGVDPLLKAAADPDPRVRTAAVRALADRKEPPAAVRGAAEAACRDPDPRVRSAGIEALSRWKGLPGALPLLGRLAAEKGRLYGDAWRGLRRISGEDLPPVPILWQKWWQTRPGEDGWKFDGPVEPPEVAVNGAGIGTFSRRVLFVLDLSEGMADRPGYRGDDLAPADERGDAEVLQSWREIRSRLDHARAHLARMIRRLPADAHFEIAFGAESANFLFGGLRPATAENRDRALGRLKGLSAKERQDTFRLLKCAWTGKAEGDPLSAEAGEKGADAIVYLGTALPTWGVETEPGRIASSVRRWNRVRQVQFLGVGVGNHGSGLLSDLAAAGPAGETSAIP